MELYGVGKVYNQVIKQKKKLYSDKGLVQEFYGPDAKNLFAFSWKLQCSSKLRNFV